jgi:hypothetical protein
VHVPTLFHRAFGRTRAIVLSAAILSGAALPAAGLWAGPASAQPAVTVPTSTSLTSSHNPSIYGQLVTFTATVTPTAGFGTVSFHDGIVTIPGCSARPLHFVFGQWRATCSTAFLPGGVNPIRAFYSGSGVFLPSIGGPVNQLVLRAPTHLTAHIIFNIHQTFTVFAGLSSFFHPVPFQPVLFKTGPIPLCLALTNIHGIASCDLSYAKSVAIRQNAGRFTAIYFGNGNYRPSFAFGQGIIHP